MKKSLVIVESPSKAKTINKFLGQEFNVKATVGHIKNLPESVLGVDIEKGYIPKYVTIPKQKKIVKELKLEAEKAGEIFIATDPDREGEAIAFHIAKEIGKNEKNIHRAFFNEITRNAVINAIDNPLKIDEKKVSAQQARRVMDRLVGYKVSPILWKAIYKGSLSAGRVQSVALKLICDREKEVLDFKQEEYWTIHVLLETTEKESFKAKLVRINGEKAEIHEEETAGKLIDKFRNEPFTILKLSKKKVKRQPSPPYITSTIQQDASTRLGFSPSKTMLIAQQLYEGIELGKEGSIGLITYMRTDSMRFSDEALTSIRELIIRDFNTDNLPNKPRTYKKKTKGKIQDAHECIRPTYFDRKPDDIKQYLSPDQYKLYKLIWNRTIACQMKDALFDQTTVEITAGDMGFRSTGRVVAFQGFLNIWQEMEKNGNSEKEVNGDEISALPAGLKNGMPLALKKEEPEQHFTQPPPRFSESSLVKELDQLGIGRPSTYAMTVSTLQNRKYTKKEKKRIFPTELGQIVNRVAIDNFSDIFNVNFTAEMENELDHIESGKKEYKTVLDNFYHPFLKNLDKVQKDVKSIKKNLEEKAGFKCEKCGKEMVVKWGRFGKFYACSGFPECKNILEIEEKGEKKAKTEPEKAGFKCEKCGNEMVVRTGRHGKFYGCSAYPKCKSIVQLDKKTTTKAEPEKAGFKCEKCGNDMLIRAGRHGKFFACSGFPKCKNTVSLKDRNGES